MNFVSQSRWKLHSRFTECIFAMITNALKSISVPFECNCANISRVSLKCSAPWTTLEIRMGGGGKSFDLIEMSFYSSIEMKHVTYYYSFIIHNCNSWFKFIYKNWCCCGCCGGCWLYFFMNYSNKAFSLRWKMSNYSKHF